MRDGAGQGLASEYALFPVWEVLSVCHVQKLVGSTGLAGLRLPQQNAADQAAYSHNSGDVLLGSGGYLLHVFIRQRESLFPSLVRAPFLL